MNKWQVLKSEDVSPSHWLKVEKQTVKAPNGHIADDFFIARLGEFAVVVRVTKDGKLIFVRQYRHAVGEVMLEFPAGSVEKQETPEDNAVKELEQEVGIKFPKEKLVKLGTLIPVPHKIDMRVHGFLASGVEFNSKQSLDELEEVEIVQLSVEEALEKVDNGEISQSDTVAFLMKYQRKKSS